MLDTVAVPDRLDATFAALADPTRRAILGRLARGEATVLAIAQPFAMSQPAVSRHLKVLEAAGLVERRVEGNTRPCRIAPAGLKEINRWLAALRTSLEANYRRLDELLAEQTQKEEEQKNDQDDA
ncbi:MAG TPA: metalloregulator ArsR/SmtB family transcription factor [Sphingomicrobium sp.]